MCQLCNYIIKWVDPIGGDMSSRSIFNLQLSWQIPDEPISAWRYRRHCFRHRSRTHRRKRHVPRRWRHIRLRHPRCQSLAGRREVVFVELSTDFRHINGDEIYLSRDADRCGVTNVRCRCLLRCGVLPATRTRRFLASVLDEVKICRQSS